MAAARQQWRPSLSWMLQVLAFNEALAVPIALVNITAGGEAAHSIIGASVYTQMIGFLCFAAGALLEGHCSDMAVPARVALSLATNAVLALIGGLLAGFVLTVGFGYRMNRHASLLNLATGVSVTMLVAIGKATQSRL